MNRNNRTKNKLKGITIKFKEREKSLMKTSFFDALQQISSPYKKEPQKEEAAYQAYPFCKEVTLSLFDKGTASTSIKYDPDGDKIIIEEKSEGYTTDKGEALTKTLEHIMINHGNYHSFFVMQPKDGKRKRKAPQPLKPR